MPELSSTRKFVLVALADAADDHGVCYPSIAHIIEKTSLDRKTVLDCMAELKASGFITETGEMKGKTKQIPVVMLHLDKSTKNGTISCKANQTVPNFPPNSPVFPPKQSQKRDTEPYTNPKEPYNSEIESEKKKVALTEATILKARELAPVWDVELLERKFVSLCETGVMPRDPNKAFLNWVMSYTKGKPPGEFSGSKTSEVSTEGKEIQPYEPYQNKMDDWRKRMAQWNRDGWWQAGWGPEPGKDGCKVPNELDVRSGL